MVDEQEVIKRQMESTRASLAEKIEALGTQVSDTVQSTTEAVTNTVEAVSSTVENVKGVVESVSDTVQDTVQSVTDKVQDTVQSVADTLNFPKLVEERPWLVFGGSVALGVVGGYLLSGSSSSSRERREASSGGGSWFGGPSAQDMTARMASTNQQAPSQNEGSWGQTNTSSQPTPSTFSGSTGNEHQVDRSTFGGSGWLWDQLSRLKNLGLAALMGAVRDLSVRSLPEAIGHKLAEEVDHMTTTMGAEPIRGTVLGDQASGSQIEQSPGGRGSVENGATSGGGQNGGHGSTQRTPATSGAM